MYNNSSSVPCKLPTDARHGFGLVFVSVIGFAILVVCLVANILVILAFSKTKSLRKPSNVLLVNLAVADILFSVVGFPVNIIPDFLPHLYCDTSYLTFQDFVEKFLVRLSCHTVQVIAVERFFAIQFPYKYVQIVGTKFTGFLSLASFVFSLITSILAISLNNPTSFKTVALIILIVSVVSTILMYIRMYIISARHLARDKSYGIVNQESKAMTSVVIACVNGVSWIPAFIVALVHQHGGDLGQWGKVPYLILMMGTCANLGVYSYRMSVFRNAVKALLRRSKPIFIEPRMVAPLRNDREMVEQRVPRY